VIGVARVTVSLSFLEGVIKGLSPPASAFTPLIHPFHLDQGLLSPHAQPNTNEPYSTQRRESFPCLESPFCKWRTLFFL